MWFLDGDDDDDDKSTDQQPNVEAGDYNLGDDAGERIGEGNDSVEKNIL